MKTAKSYTHDHLMSLLKNPTTLRLIDVRDVDFGTGGRIKYCTNVPSCDFTVDKAKSIIKSCLEQEVSNLVCYCSYGRARSVQCATLLSDVLAEEHPDAQLSVGYLQGGFSNFNACYFNSDYIVPVTNRRALF